MAEIAIPFRSWDMILKEDANSKINVKVQNAEVPNFLNISNNFMKLQIFPAGHRS